MSLLQRTELSRFTLHASRFIACLIVASVCLPVMVRAETSEPRVSIGAGAANTDFRTSSIEFEPVSEGEYTLVFKLQNSGHLSAEDARISLILSDGWRYERTKGDYKLVQTQERPYGQSVEWELLPIAGGGTAELRSTIALPEGDTPTPLFAALTSAYSTPVYAEIDVGEVEPTSFWASRIRSFWLYLSYSTKEAFYRLFSWLNLA